MIKASDTDRIYYQNLGTAIRKLRGLCSISFVSLSEKTGLSKSYLHKLENGSYATPLHTVIKLATGLGMPLYLFMYMIEDGHSDPYLSKKLLDFVHKELKR